MDPALLVTFAATFGIAAAVPGPNMVALVARVLARGHRGVLPFCGGMILGEVVWILVSATGLAALAQVMQPVFLAIRYLGAAYLLWLAYRLWTLPARPLEAAPIAEGGGLALMGTGIALSLGNPKIMLFYLSLLPAVVPLERLTALGLVELLATMFVVYSAVLGSYVLLASRARRLLGNIRALKAVNRATGAVMAGAAVGVVTQ